MDKAVIYARVSSTGDRQSTERQVADLTRYAASAGLDVVQVFEEKASGAKRDREQLAACVGFLKGGGAGTLLVSELSRLGRSLRQVLEVVEDLTATGIDIYFQDHRMHTLKEDGTPDPVTKMLVSMLGSFAEMEREQIAYRLQSGRRVALEQGRFKPGRPKGSGMTNENLLAKYPKAVKRLQAGRTIREVAGEFGLSSKTVQKIRKAIFEDRVLRGIEDIKNGNYTFVAPDNL